MQQVRESPHNILRYTGPPLIPVLRLKGSPCLNIDDDDDYYYYYNDYPD